jgi:predicted transposase YdaD
MSGVGNGINVTVVGPRRQDRVAKPFDATLKDLIARYLDDWPAYLGHPPGTIAELDESDLSAVTSPADRVVRIFETEESVLHLELQASADPDLPARLLRYVGLLFERRKVPIDSTVILLRPEAVTSNLTGVLEFRAPRTGKRLLLEYDVVRVWEQPVESFLEGGLGTLPLAPLCNDARSRLPEVLRAIDERIEEQLPPGEAADLRTATYILMGLRYRPEQVRSVYRGLAKMRESSTYQAILEEGRAEGVEVGRAEGVEVGRAEGVEVGRAEGSLSEAQRILLILGTERFGAPSAEVQARVASESGVERLEELTRRVLTAQSWEELLGA